ncbi:MAG: hypothetical protein ACM3ML_08320 [Micromonosporaceae bacterium]
MAHGRPERRNARASVPGPEQMRAQVFAEGFQAVRMAAGNHQHVFGRAERGRMAAHPARSGLALTAC